MARSSGTFQKGHQVPLEVRQKISKTLRGHLVTEETRKKIGEKGRGRTSPQKGKRLSEEQKKKMVETRRKNGSYLRGVNNPNWRGGMQNYQLNERIRKSFEYSLWRKAVFERDKWTCIWCGDNKGGNLEADHIKAFSQYPELRFAIDNGRTLCRECHKKTDNYAGKGLKRSKLFQK